MGEVFFFVDTEDQSKPKAMAFIDGQNLFAAARDRFGHQWALYDPRKLAVRVANAKGLDLSEVRFYTGMPLAEHNRRQHAFWQSKIAQMGRSGPGEVPVRSITKPLRYREEEVRIHGGGTLKHFVAREKGIDVRIALDVIRCFLQKQYECVIIFSQDQDLNEVVAEVKRLAKLVNRPVQVCSAFPDGPNERGIEGADWFRMPEALYNECLDPRNYGHLPNLRS